MREVIWAVEVSLKRIERNVPAIDVKPETIIENLLAHYTGALPEDKARALYAACDHAFDEAHR